MGAALFVYLWIIVDAILILGLKKVVHSQKTEFGVFQGHPGGPLLPPPRWPQNELELISSEVLSTALPVGLS